MAIGLKTTVTGANISPNLALRRATSDSVDAAALELSSDLLLRVDPRDILRTTANPTGKGLAHRTAPNGDPILFRNPASISVGTVPGMYNGEDVFIGAAAGAAAAANDLSVYFNSIGGNVALSVIGAAHYSASMLGAGFHGLLALRRDGSAIEQCLVHQYSGGVNYISAFTDQGDGGGANYNMDSGSAIAADTPFVFLWQALSSGSSRLYINTSIDSPIITGGSGSPETGVMRLWLMTTTTYTQQWVGALGRCYVFAGDVRDTAAKKAKALALMAETMSLYGIA